MGFRLGAARFCRSFCGLPVHMRGRQHRDCSLCNRSGPASRLVGSVRGRLPVCALEWCCCPINELWRSCILYDSCSRCLVSCESWIGNLTGLKHLIRAEPEQPANEYANSHMECDGRPSFLRLWIPHAHSPRASLQQGLPTDYLVFDLSACLSADSGASRP
jgi:hypothetical protein